MNNHDYEDGFDQEYRYALRALTALIWLMILAASLITTIATGLVIWLIIVLAG
jgi:hypothetical protein